MHNEYEMYVCTLSVDKFPYKLRCIGVCVCFFSAMACLIVYYQQMAKY